MLSVKPVSSKDSIFFENRIAPEWVCTKAAAAILGITPNALRIRKCCGEIECRYFRNQLRFNVNYLASGTVDQLYRGKGIYKTMVSHRAKVARDLGHKYLLIHAKNHTSAPICQALSFEKVYEYSVVSKEILQ